MAYDALYATEIDEYGLSKANAAARAVELAQAAVDHLTSACGAWGSWGQVGTRDPSYKKNCVLHTYSI